MDIVANKTKRLKRANKENIECLSESAAPLKKIKVAGAVGAEMVSFERIYLLERLWYNLLFYVYWPVFSETNRH